MHHYLSVSISYDYGILDGFFLLMEGIVCVHGYSIASVYFGL